MKIIILHKHKEVACLHILAIHIKTHGSVSLGRAAQEALGARKREWQST